MIKNICPVCGNDGLSEPAYKDGYNPSYEICSCCGYHFGYHDEALEVPISFEEWRKRWIAEGMKWWSDVGRQPPAGWNPKKQLVNIGVFV